MGQGPESLHHFQTTFNFQALTAFVDPSLRGAWNRFLSRRRQFDFVLFISFDQKPRAPQKSHLFSEQHFL